MKKIITFLIVVMVTLIAKADHSTLLFRTLGGGNHYLAINGLEISFTQENLVASNDVTNISIPLSQIESMEFSGLAVGVNPIDSDKMNGGIFVYSLRGTSLGIYPSFSEALNNVPNGIYLFKYVDVTTLKIEKNETYQDTCSLFIDFYWRECADTECNQRKYCLFLFRSANRGNAVLARKGNYNPRKDFYNFGAFGHPGGRRHYAG